MTGTPPTLTRRQLNRALLARQDLLARAGRSVPEEVEHLVGLQAQEPLDPYTALWSRLEGFAPAALGAGLEDRTLARLVTWRGTVHLHTADDALLARGLAQEVVERRISPGNVFGRATAGVDLDAVLADVWAWIGEEPRSGAEVKARIGEAGSSDVERLVDVVKYLLPTVQVPPRGVWGRSGAARWAPLDQWLGRPLAAAGPDDEDAVILRYLAAFGPASAADIATWSGWIGVRAKLDRLAGRLVTYRHEDTGRLLVDVPDGARPDPDVPAPVRFLPEFDDVLLSHADRSRIVPDGLGGGALVEVVARPRVVLVDGSVGGLWSIRREDGRATLVLRPLVRWTRAQRRDAETEGVALLGLHAPDADHDVDVIRPERSGTPAAARR
ncbi:winged helix DNA-binding domain-containing protein [Iamia sp. SCSIO 61187]|uniref:winged helix DNA-binding domain-containing protein n=1 Tax=Iamia sp. SCSIO 61187 TaxID=2722752 RepID=UPI001C62B66B|nr:winged helix DNA-binding domain-containing protein [Iamia sp. SCSIO 61187]QYG91418.1 winged helix DNA-binding domain-containing protein [Iamia sp. SCSIO 61187]